MKWLYNHLEYFAIVLLTGLLLFFAFSKNPPAPARATYAETLFDDSVVHRIELSLSESDLSQILENPVEKTKYHADIVIDGELIKDVSISTRGNATLFAGAELENFNTYSYKINFQKWHNEKSYRGLDTLYLNNFFSDWSYLKEYLSYYLMRSAGVPAPLTSYTEVYINNELRGFYLAIEGYDKSYLKRANVAPDSVLFKPEPLANDSSRFHELEQSDPEQASRLVRDVFMEGYDAEGADLVYTNDSPASYSAIFRNNLTKASPADERQVVSAVKTLALGSETELESAWDIDALARYAAVHNFLINSDSYIGLIPHNYLLKLDSDSKKLSLLPWDYDLAGHVSWSAELYPDTESSAQIPFDDPYIGLPLEQRPLWNRLKNNPTFREKYISVFRELLTDELFSDRFLAELTEKYELIKNHILEDPGRQVDMSDVEAEVAYLREFFTLRTDSIARELSNRELLTSLDLRLAPAEL